VDGKQVSLSSYKGHPVWLTFGATWCAACKAEAPDIQAAYKKFEPKGVVVLSIFIREDSATVKDYADRIGLTVPQGGRPRHPHRVGVPGLRDPGPLLHRRLRHPA